MQVRLEAEPRDHLMEFGLLLLEAVRSLRVEE